MSWLNAYNGGLQTGVAVGQLGLAGEQQMMHQHAGNPGQGFTWQSGERSGSMGCVGAAAAHGGPCHGPAATPGWQRSGVTQHQHWGCTNANQDSVEVLNLAPLLNVEALHYHQPVSAVVWAVTARCVT
ncbi:hypothetical protein HaLaN_04102 [Haematococcus lacustris]|uniref:Uncharacterized protein n=1 Tax=Haematococcus lacustris TaxID=44745 RepID=A0A699YIH8_HAELA|nr:hypothetical protein HaLaN_04102 [Haematococcus lacustris]